MSTAKAEAFARVITGKAVTVVAGRKSDGPHTDGRKITLGQAVDWDIEDRFGVLFHECCHLMFPALYPTGGLREVANLIDDCRIERQAINDRPQYADALACVATNVIANGCYENPHKDRFTEENFDPCTWALLFLRPHVGEEVRLAVAECVKAYAANKGLDKVEGWNEKFEKLTKEGQRITRLRTVSKETLAAWGTLYFETFPQAAKDMNGEVSVQIFQDRPAPKGDQQKDSEGSGDAKADAKIRAKACGKDEPSEDEGEEEGEGKGEGEGEESKDEAKEGQEGGSKGKSDKQSSEEVQGTPNLKEALEKLLKAVGEVGDKSKDKVTQAGEADRQIGEVQSIPVGTGDEVSEDVGGDAPGSEVGKIGSVKTNHAVNKNFVNSAKSSIRKLRCLAMDQIQRFRNTGRLHMPTVIRAEQKGVMPRRPFQRTMDDVIDAPVACVVATDFSGSTEGAANPSLNAFSHNALFALQEAGCECAEVIWNSDAWITKCLDERVSPVQTHFHKSTGGTSLVACSAGCVKSLKLAKAQRKIAFIFTDGGVSDSEVPMVDLHLRKNGFEAVLLVSIGSEVPKCGIVQTVVCKSISELSGIFDRFVRQQTAKTVQGA
jgi:hypothetical protein